jgi:hypothetical protein
MSSFLENAMQGAWAIASCSVLKCFLPIPRKTFFCSEFERNALKLAAFFSFPALGRG